MLERKNEVYTGGFLDVTQKWNKGEKQSGLDF